MIPSTQFYVVLLGIFQMSVIPKYNVRMEVTKIPGTVRDVFVGISFLEFTVRIKYHLGPKVSDCYSTSFEIWKFINSSVITMINLFTKMFSMVDCARKLNIQIHTQKLFVAHRSLSLKL